MEEIRVDEEEPLTMTQRLQQASKKAIQTNVLRQLSLCAIVFALVGGNLWQLFDVPDDPGNLVLDTLMVIVLLFFVAELVLHCYGQQGYVFSFFFWMDGLGSISMVLDISFLLGPAGKSNSDSGAIDPTLLRIAKLSKLAFRAGRYAKLIKLISQIFKNRKAQEDGVESKKLSGKLQQDLSARVSFLTIFLVCVLPLFELGTYPTADLSMRAWSEEIELRYAEAVKSAAGSTSLRSDVFKTTLERMDDFYKGNDYHPFEISGFPSNVKARGGTEVTVERGSVYPQSRPNRKQNILQQHAKSCLLKRPKCEDGDRSYVEFDFTRAALWQAFSDIGLALFAMVVMLIVSMNIGKLVDQLVVRPVENIIGIMRANTGAIVGRLEASTTTDEVGSNDSGENADELTMLKGLLRKLAVLVEISCKQKEEMMTKDDFNDLRIEEQGVLVDMLGAQVGAQNQRATDVNQLRRRTWDWSGPGNDLTGMPKDSLVNLDLVNSWDLDILKLSREEQECLIKYIMFDSTIGKATVAWHANIEVFRGFFPVLLKSYNDTPFHNGVHALDVTHVVYRLSYQTVAVEWASSVAIFGLIVAALAHDLGHQGRTNPFLVETRHAWALQYNDVSPLENMHCATLFQITQEPEANIFGQLTLDKYKEVRKVCVSTILHTDNVHHFEMVKGLETIYEMNKESCDQQAASKPGILHESHRDTLFKDQMLFLQLLLHFSDVSNPLRPFEICEKWAHLILEEFFAQGDEEKEKGLPVGMLNDRDKISRCGSQHGFINFLVAPLVFATISIFPAVHELGTQMGDNLQEWRNLWAEEAEQEEDTLNRRDHDIQVVKEKAQKLASRCSYTPPTRRSRFSGVGMRSVRKSMTNLVRGVVASKETE